MEEGTDCLRRFAALLNYATLPFYWGGYEPQEGKTQEARLEQMADWCRAHHIAAEDVAAVFDFQASVARRTVAGGTGYEAVKMQLANRRSGTSSTKTRADVSGGGVKPLI